MKDTSGVLRILNLNCGGLSAKFNKLKLFLADYNDHLLPISLITLQETHFSSNTDLQFFDLPDYTLISDNARINSFGGVAIYLHNSYSFTRFPNNQFNQNSCVHESMFIEIFHNHSKFNKFLIGNIYRRPSEKVEELSKFIQEFTETLHFVHERSKQAYINGDFNIDLLKLNCHHYYNLFYESVTAQGFFPKITRPTRSDKNSHTLIDNIFTNNLGKSHTSGIITTHISDHFMIFCILEGRQVDLPKPNM